LSSRSVSRSRSGTPDRHQTDQDAHVALAERHRHDGRPAVRRPRHADRQSVRVQQRIALPLASSRCSDCRSSRGHRRGLRRPRAAPGRSRTSAVAREDAEAPGVDRKGSVRPNSAEKYAIRSPSAAWRGHPGARAERRPRSRSARLQPAARGRRVGGGPASRSGGHCASAPRDFGTAPSVGIEPREKGRRDGRQVQRRSGQFVESLQVLRQRPGRSVVLENAHSVGT
jgi:hypothetical protein